MRRSSLLLAATLASFSLGPPALSQSLVFCRPAAAVRGSLASPCEPVSSVFLVPPPETEARRADAAPSADLQQPRTPAPLPLPYRAPDARLFMKPVRPYEFFPEESRILMRSPRENAVDLYLGVRVPY